ncbi:SDR family oxidoreductase [Nonomuraea angiospora]|uniref:NAD(P)-dependent dehydrogenase (Short-subunit alcohol dehydrogenase family) n=1 Tax=Nonomuraea angiospora TaxID=46172 RepID=A0ABR9M3Z5_9ACTN|nr:SDR family oxidoreductase [Nonomuraea angiospora]MBE1587645.1 NAD(P)-dependent dehydrogenase (short-subunit alcohol dehydrogenase family) [Nonomuraea angiospora]
MRVVIVGGTSGIGLAAAARLAAGGAEVVVTGRSEERLRSALKQLGDQARGEVVDARDTASMRALFEGLGTVDHLVVTVTGRGGAGPLSSLTGEGLTEAWRNKLVPHLLTAQAALGVLNPEGSITFVTAASAGAALPGIATLAAVNGAIEAAVPGLAVELAPIRVNAVSPGVIDTDWWSEIGDEARAAFMEGAAESLPVRRVGRPEDVAATIEYVVRNAYTTGIVLTVDGGARLKA